MSEQRIIFEYPDELPQKLYTDMPEGETKLLFHTNPLTSTIGFVATRVTVLRNDFGQKIDDQIHLSSELEMTEPSQITPALIASDIGNYLPRYLVDVLGYPYNYRPLWHGGLTLESRDPDTTDLGLAIMSLHGGTNWAINSAVGIDVERNQYDEDLPAIDDHLRQHTAALGALCTELHNRNSRDTTSNYKRVFAFTLPENDVSLEIVPLQLEKAASAPIEDPFEQFAGISHVVSQLREIVELANIDPITREQFEVDPVQSVLLYGPSGVGKTALIRALATALGATLDEVAYRDASGSFVTEAARNIEARFRQAAKNKERTVIFLDEFDGLVNVGNQEVNNGITSMLKVELEKIKEYPQVFFAAASNNIDRIDPVLRVAKRIPVAIEITSPTEHQRAEIIQQHVMSSMKWDLDDPATVEHGLAQLDGLDFKALAREADNLSGSDIREAIQSVRKQHLLEYWRAGESQEPRLPTQAELLDALARIRRRT